MNPHHQQQPAPQNTQGWFRDLDGIPIPTQFLYLDASSQPFDTRHLRIDGRIWTYKGRMLMMDNAGVVRTGYADTAYRSVNDHDDDSDDDTFASSDRIRTLTSSGSNRTVGRKNSQTTPAPRRPADSSFRQSRFRDMRIDTNPQLPLQQDHHQHIVRLNPTDHFQQIANYTTTVNRVKITDPRKRRLGFQVEDLNMMSAISCTPCRPSSLSYAPQLTVFRQDHFHDTPDSIFEVLKPALALCELIILQGNPDFWINVACAPRELQYDLNNVFGPFTERLRPMTSFTAEQQQHTLDLLQRLGRRITYRWAAMEPYGEHVGSTVIMHTLPREDFLVNDHFWPAGENLVRLAWEPSDPWDRNSTINLNKDFFMLAKRIATLQYPDTTQVLRFNLFLAINICHELAHAFERKCGNSNYIKHVQQQVAAEMQTRSGFQPSPFRRYPNRRQEAYWDNMTWNEMGGVFEIETFGGRVHPLAADAEMRYGLVVYNGDGWGNPGPTASDNFHAGKPFGSAVPMSFIEEIQQASFWLRPQSQKSLIVPTFGAVSSWGAAALPMDWREFLLARDHPDGPRLSTAQLLDALYTGADDDRDTKRVRVDDSSVAKTPLRPLRRHTLPMQRFLQTRIRQYPRRGDMDDDQLRAQMRADAAKHDAKAQAQAQQAHAAADVARQYQPPPANQPAIDDVFRYRGDSPDSDATEEPEAYRDPSSDHYDPLKIPVDSLSHADKWCLFEEYCSLNFGWDSATFLLKRHQGQFFPASPAYIPLNDQSWDELAMHELRRLRALHPTRSFPVIRQQESQTRKQNQRLWRILNQMEELCVFLGFSRIEFQRLWQDSQPLPFGMTVENFDANFFPLLDSYRLVNEVEGSDQFQQSVDAGDIVPRTNDLGIGTIPGQALIDDGLIQPHFDIPSQTDNPTNISTRRITDFFRPVGSNARTPITQLPANPQGTVTSNPAAGLPSGTPPATNTVPNSAEVSTMPGQIRSENNRTVGASPLVFNAGEGVALPFRNAGPGNGHRHDHHHHHHHNRNHNGRFG